MNIYDKNRKIAILKNLKKQFRKYLKRKARVIHRHWKLRCNSRKTKILWVKAYALFFLVNVCHWNCSRASAQTLGKIVNIGQYCQCKTMYKFNMKPISNLNSQHGSILAIKKALVQNTYSSLEHLVISLAKPNGLVSMQMTQTSFVQFRHRFRFFKKCASF